MTNISINARSSIRIEGTKVIYFDPFKITEEKHDADIIFITMNIMTIFHLRTLRKFLMRIRSWLHHIVWKRLYLKR